MYFVSIIMPLFNKALYVENSIKSVLMQSIDSWELIIVDNGSTDNSVEIVKKYTDKRISLINCPERGPSKARNYGVTKAKGEWILFLDADDLIEKNYLKQYEIITENHPNAKIVVGGWKEFNTENMSEHIIKYHIGNNTSAKIKELAIGMAPWAVHAAIVRRNILKNNTTWPEVLDEFLGEDIAFWFSLLNVFGDNVIFNKYAGALYRKNILDCRTKLHDPGSWFNGVDRAIKYNLKFMRENNITLTRGHCETLVRIYSELYLNAKKQLDNNVADRAILESEKWLQMYIDISHDLSLTMQLRKIIGLKKYLFIKNMLTKN